MRSPFIPAWKKQYDFTERVVDEARIIMDKPEVIDALAEKAVFLLNIMEFITPRPVKNGEIEAGVGDDDNAIYTVSLAVGEKAKIPSTKTNGFQLAAATHVFGAEAAQKFMIRKEIPMSIVMNPDMYGVCTVATGTSEADDPELRLGNLYARGRPSIGLLYDKEARVDWRALTLLHEIDHAGHHMAFPIQFAKSDDELYLRSELSAYSTQSAIARALGITDDRYVPHQIEDIRREFNGDISSNEAYKARAEIADRLSEKGLSHIYQ